MSPTKPRNEDRTKRHRSTPSSNYSERNLFERKKQREQHRDKHAGVVKAAPDSQSSISEMGPDRRSTQTLSNSSSSFLGLQGTVNPGTGTPLSWQTLSSDQTGASRESNTRRNINLAAARPDEPPHRMHPTTTVTFFDYGPGWNDLPGPDTRESTTSTVFHPGSHGTTRHSTPPNQSAQPQSSIHRYTTRRTTAESDINPYLDTVWKDAISGVRHRMGSQSSNPNPHPSNTSVPSPDPRANHSS